MTACTTTGPWNQTASTITVSRTSRAPRAPISSGRWRRTAKGAAPGARHSGRVHVEPGIDPGRTGVTLVDVVDQPGGRRGTLVIEPRDCYGNPLGPGRAGGFTVAPLPGVRVDGKVKDRGDGSYEVAVVWDFPATPVPGVLVYQPDRDPVPMTPPTAFRPPAFGTAIPPPENFWIASGCTIRT